MEDFTECVITTMKSVLYSVYIVYKMINQRKYRCIDSSQTSFLLVDTIHMPYDQIVPLKYMYFLLQDICLINSTLGYWLPSKHMATLKYSTFSFKILLCVLVLKWRFLFQSWGTSHTSNKLVDTCLSCCVQKPCFVKCETELYYDNLYWKRLNILSWIV